MLDVGLEGLFEFLPKPNETALEKSNIDETSKKLIQTRVEMTNIVTENAVEIVIDDEGTNN